MTLFLLYCVPLCFLSYYNINMIVENPENYKLKGFEKSHLKQKKYDAILENKITKKIKKIPFGDKSYEQYKDSTGLDLYSHLNQNDKERRKNYLSRHAKDKDNKFSSGYFSAKYLW